MKGYHDITGDGGSRVLEQVSAQRARIADGLAGVRHLEHGAILRIEVVKAI